MKALTLSLDTILLPICIGIFIASILEILWRISQPKQSKVPIRVERNEDIENYPRENHYPY